jgi:predicted nuclease with TOPRIM domain
MNFKIVLPWICAVGLGAALAATFVSNRSKDAELSRLREDNAQLQQTQTALEEAQTRAKTGEEQIADLKKDREELLRLRGEVNRLNGEKQQLSKQAQQAQANAERAQSQIAQSSQSSAQQMQQLQSENQQLRGAAVQGQMIAQRDACISNLRLINTAKQQWAAQNNKTADAVPTMADLTPYLNNVTPICPMGGTYSPNALNMAPTCSAPGHVLR